MRHVAILAVIALVLMGCGGSDGDADPSSTTATTSADETTTVPTIQTTTTEAESGDDFSPETCPTLMNWANDSVMAFQAAFGGGGTGASGVEFSADYFQAFADEAPDEIADDVQVFADAFDAFFTALEDMGSDLTDPSAMAGMTAAQVQQLEEATELMDNEEVEQAADNIEAYLEDVCGG